MKTFKKLFKYSKVIYLFIFSLMIFENHTEYHFYFLIFNVFVQIFTIVLLFIGVYSLKDNWGKFYLFLFLFFLLYQILLFVIGSEIYRISLMSASGVVMLYMAVTSKEDKEILEDASLLDDSPMV